MTATGAAGATGGTARPVDLVYLTTAAVPSRMASSVHVMRMCRAHAARGLAVVLLVPDVAVDADLGVTDVHAFYGVPPSFRVERVPWPRLPGRGWWFALAQARRARRLRPRLVHARTLRGAAATVALGLPTVLEVHDLPSLTVGLDAPLARWLVRRRRLVRLVAISGALATDVVARLPAVADRLVVAHDAADPPVDPDPPAEDPLGPRRPGTRLRAGYVGQLHPGKGGELLVALARAMPWLEVHVVGGTPERVRALAALAGDGGADGADGLPNLVLHGSRPPADLDGVRAACDVLLAPYGQRVEGAGGGVDISRWTSPLKVFEAMVAGRPLVATDLAVLREVLTDGVDALLVPADDVAAWTAALTRLRDDPGLGPRLAAAARTRALAEHTWDARAAAILAGLDVG